MGKFDTDSGIDTMDECDMETAEVSENVDTDENTDSETNELEEYDVPAITEEIENATGAAELEEWPEPEMTLTQEELNEILENEKDTERLRNLRDLVTSGQIGVEMEEPEELEDLALEDDPIVETCEEVDEEQVEDAADVEEINENNIDYNDCWGRIYINVFINTKCSIYVLRSVLYARLGNNGRSC